MSNQGTKTEEQLKTVLWSMVPKQHTWSLLRKTQNGTYNQELQ